MTTEAAATTSAGSTRKPAHVAPPPSAFAGLAALCVAGILLVRILGRSVVPTQAAEIALVVQAGLFLLLGWIYREQPRLQHRIAQSVGLVAVGLLAGPSGYFFGPNSGFGALVALILVSTGVLTGGAPVRHPALGGWLTYLALVVGQAVAFTLVALGRLPDDSLVHVIVGSHPMWHHVTAHVWLQIVYLAAFLAGRAFQRRYLKLAREVDAAMHAAAQREALLDEARAEYRRALAIGRHAVAADASRHSASAPHLRRPKDASDTFREGGPKREPTALAGTVAAQPAVRPASISKPPAPSDALVAGTLSAGAWRDAYRSKMRGFYLGVIAFCVPGALFLGIVAQDRLALWIAWASIAGIGAAAWLHRWITLRHHEERYWPWVIIGVLSIGPAYSIGLHTGFSSLIAAWLFAGCLFRATQHPTWLGSRAVLLTAVVVAHTALFVLVMTGIVADAGNVRIMQPGTPKWSTVMQHALLMSIYVASILAGLSVDRRYQALTLRGLEATREAARQATLLASARADLEHLLADETKGLFSGMRVGRYEVGPVLGRGGMGEVYAATERGTGRRIALKLVRSDRVAEPANLQLFLREADTLTRVQSAFIARVIEVVGLEREVPYIAMEYVEGRTLADLLREQGRLSPAEVRLLTRHVGRGLHDVHAAGLVHRDLKPHNVIRTTLDHAPWKLVDFGMAAGADATSPNALAGTPPYMSPEQARGEVVDARSDLYSLCLVVYRALTGRPAFVSQSANNLERAQLADPRNFMQLPEDVVLALRIGLAVQAEDRFANALELVRAFEGAFEERLDDKHRRHARRLLRRQPFR